MLSALLISCLFHVSAMNSAEIRAVAAPECSRVVSASDTREEPQSNAWALAFESMPAAPGITPMYRTQSWGQCHVVLRSLQHLLPDSEAIPGARGLKRVRMLAVHRHRSTGDGNTLRVQLCSLLN